MISFPGNFRNPVQRYRDVNEVCVEIDFLY